MDNGKYKEKGKTLYLEVVFHILPSISFLKKLSILILKSSVPTEEIYDDFAPNLDKYIAVLAVSPAKLCSKKLSFIFDSSIIHSPIEQICIDLTYINLKYLFR